MPYKDKEKRLECQRRYYADNKERMQAYYAEADIRNGPKYILDRKLRQVKKIYNLDAEEYIKMLEEQDNSCFICKKKETILTKYGTTKALAVDHDHVTGKVRSLLCNSCNCLLGNANDSIEILQRAMNYLKSHKEV